MWPEPVPEGAGSSRFCQLGREHSGRAREGRQELTDGPLSDAARLVLREQLLANRALMQRRLSALVRNFEDLVESAELQPPDDEHDPDGTTAFDRAQVTSLALATRARLVEVDRALLGIDDEDFGACEHCGQPIGLARLQALPGVRRCVCCASTGSTGTSHRSLR